MNIKMPVHLESSHVTDYRIIDSEDWAIARINEFKFEEGKAIGEDIVLAINRSQWHEGLKEALADVANALAERLQSPRDPYSKIVETARALLVEVERQEKGTK